MNLGRISHILRKSPPIQPLQVFSCRSRNFRAGTGSIKFSAKWPDAFQPVSRFSVPNRPALSRIKAPRPSSPAKRSGHERATSAPPMPGHGASDGNFRSLARVACRHTRMRHRLVRAGGRSCARPRWIRPDRWRLSRPIRRAVRAVRHPHSCRRLLHEKWRGVERKLDDERVQLALCDGDRDRCVSAGRACNSSPSSTTRGPATAAPASARSIARSISRSGR